MAKLLKITTEVYLPDATGATWQLTYPANDPYLVAGKLAGGLTQGSLEAVEDKPGWWGWPEDQQVFGGELGDSQPPLVTMRVTPTMPAGKKVLAINYQGHPREMVPPTGGTPGTGTWDLSRIGTGGPVLVAESELIALAAGLSDLSDGLALNAQSLADNAQLRDLVSQLAGSLLRPTYSAFPVAAGYSGLYAVALDTGAIYTSDGSIWGSPVGYVVNKAQADALGVRLTAVELGQAGGHIGYLTKAALDADLAHAAGALGEVTSDATPTNNGIYIKLGASGSGSWQQSSFNRLTLVENRLTVNETALSYRVAAAKTSRRLNRVPGYRTGAPSITPFVLNGALSYPANDGSWPLSPGALPNTITLTVAAAGNAYYGLSTALDSVVWATGRQLTWGTLVRRADLTALNTTFDTVIWWRNAAGTGNVSTATGPALTATQLGVLGTTATLNGVTATVRAVDGGDSHVQYTAAAPAGTYAAILYLRATNAANGGTLRMAAPTILCDAATIDPYTVYPETAVEADPLPTIIGNAASVTALLSQVPPPPLAPITYVNALRSRLSSVAGAADPTRYQLGVFGGTLDSATTPSLNYVYDATAYSTYALPNVIESKMRVSTGGFGVTTLTILPADLALLGIVPDDTTPPRISVRVGVLKASLGNLTASKLFDLTTTTPGQSQLWVALRYGTSASAGGADTAHELYWPSPTVTARFNNVMQSTAYDSAFPTRVDDGTMVYFQRANIPVPATWGGQPLTAIKLHILGKPVTEGQDMVLRVARSAVIAGAATPGTVNAYLNGAEDQVRKAVSESDLTSALLTKINNAVSIPPSRPTVSASIGDSIGHGDFNVITGNGAGQTRGAVTSFLNRAAILRGWTVAANMCISGSTIARYAGQTPIVDRYVADIVTPGAGYGHVILEGGINDHDFNVPLGALFGDSDLTHFYPAYLATAKGILDGLPNAVLTCVVPIFRPVSPGSTVEIGRNTINKATVEQYRQAIRDVVAYLQATGYAGRIVVVEMDKMSRDMFLGHPEWFDASGYHPIDQGQGGLAQLLAPALL